MCKYQLHYDLNEFLESLHFLPDCQNPPVLQNGFHNATPTTYNSTVMYSCNPGFTMFGENSITCLDTGNWSQMLVNCTIKGEIPEFVQ
ncbi:hypothetical protein DPMN_050326 [Dreissena polymorpha]|uniref:Sushi domain-containing protein n=1 Tax=Dreissena polymorpha TaxID=45954 RepID=A0A9D4CHB2_DREPO|nr:hypothetical protein DPMN_050326 [Dreissena polymorpha]